MENSVEKSAKALFLLPLALLLISSSGLAQEPSPADCEAYAKRVAMDSGSVAGGMGRGAVRGAAFGAIVGDNSKSARKGAALGAVAGGLRRHRASDEAYKSAYDSCMAGNTT